MRLRPVVQATENPVDRPVDFPTTSGQDDPRADRQSGTSDGMS